MAILQDTGTIMVFLLPLITFTGIKLLLQVACESFPSKMNQDCHDSTKEPGTCSIFKTIEIQ